MGNRMDQKLKRCPFCGGKVYMASMSDGEEGWYYIHGVYAGADCCHCRVFMESEKFSIDAPNKEEAAVKAALIEKWNRRVSE